jgi:hypothetical protein
MHVEYTPPDVLGGSADALRSLVDGELSPDAEGLGPAALAVALAHRVASGRGGVLRHALESRDGVRAESLWQLAQEAS